MLVALILVSVALAISLYVNLFGSKSAGAGPTAVAAPSVRGELEEASKARSRAESELQRKQKELDEQRSQLQEVKEQLKQTKRKLFEQKEGEKGDKDLVKARAEVERAASTQLELVRAELAQVLVENERLKSQVESGRRGRPQAAPAAAAAVTVTAAAPAPAAEAAAPAPAAEAAPAPVAAAAAAEPAREERGGRRYRDLNDADRERMEKLEASANKERARAADLEREVKRIKGRVETQGRIFNAQKGELELVKDKFKALEKRLNRTLLERDLLRRAIKDLEKKTGMLAERTELTPEEMAASDRKTEEVAQTRAAAEAQAAKAQAEAASATEAPKAEGSEAPAAAEAPASPAPNA